jgi:hypothetical protein
MFKSLKEGTPIPQPKVDEPRLISCALDVS